MEKRSIQIGERLYKEIKDYCEMNSLKLNTYVESLIRKEFAIEKYGETPFDKIISKEPEISIVQPIIENTTLEVVENIVKEEVKPIKKKVTKLN